MIGLIVTINEYKNHFKSYNKTFVCDTIENAKTELITCIASIFNILDVDFPQDVYDFERIWYDNKYVLAKIYDYKLFVNNKWETPWEYEELYYDIIDEIIKINSNCKQENSENDDDDDEQEESDVNVSDENKYQYLESKNTDKFKELEENIEKILINSKNV